MNINEINENLYKDSKELKLEVEGDDEITLKEGTKISNYRRFLNFQALKGDKKLVIIVIVILIISIIAFLISLNFIKIPNFNIKFFL